MGCNDKTFNQNNRVKNDKRNRIRRKKIST